MDTVSVRTDVKMDDCAYCESAQSSIQNIIAKYFTRDRDRDIGLGPSQLWTIYYSETWLQPLMFDLWHYKMSHTWKCVQCFMIPWW